MVRNIKEVDWRTAKPLAVGTRVRFVAGFLGRRLAYTYEVRELSRSHMVMSTDEGPFPMQTTYTWREAPGGGRTPDLKVQEERSSTCSCPTPCPTDIFAVFWLHYGTKKSPAFAGLS